MSVRYVHLYFIAAFAVAAICVGGWFAYWKLAGSAQSDRYKVNTHSQQYQSGLVSQERDRVQAYDQLGTAIAAVKDPATKTADRAQQDQIRETFCQVYADLQNTPTDLTQAHARICH